MCSPDSVRTKVKHSGACGLENVVRGQRLYFWQPCLYPYSPAVKAWAASAVALGQLTAMGRKCWGIPLHAVSYLRKQIVQSTGRLYIAASAGCAEVDTAPVETVWDGRRCKGDNCCFPASVSHEFLSNILHVTYNRWSGHCQT